ncbi:MAG: nicotinamide-nucleotide amidohydrolase family protein [Planctomycetota bacterium]
MARRIEARYRRHGIEMPPRSRQQAMVPRGAEVLANRLGTAPGLLLRSGDKLLALLPGVPSEMRDMAERSFLPRLGPATDLYARRVLRIAGLPESEVDRRLEPVARLSGEVEWTILACPGEVSLHLSELCPPSRPAAGIRRLEEEVERILGPHLFGRDEETMESVVGRILSSRGETLAVAESLTGGLVAERVTSVPGASRYFRGGVVCYSDAAKLRGAGVSARTLDRHGAVSAEVACEMARGVRGLLESTWGLAATGYAGPEGGEGGPPGTAWIALSGPGETRHRGLSLPGDRDAVRRRAAMSALDLLRRALMDAAT